MTMLDTVFGFNELKCKIKQETETHNSNREQKYTQQKTQSTEYTKQDKYTKQGTEKYRISMKVD